MAHPIKLRATPFVRDISALLQAHEATDRFAGLPHGTLRGRVVDVDDPENRGRVKVIFDDMNPEIPQSENSGGEFAEEREGDNPGVSHWIDTSPAFQGKQPAGLVGKRVNINPTGGQYTYAVLQDVLYDPQLLAQKAKDKLKVPNNSTMTRLPVYPSGSLPPASEENHGCMVVETDGPMNSDWTCVCLKRSGKYVWVRHVDLSHGHAGQNDGSQNNDTDGDGQSPVKQLSVWDSVFPTTAGEMAKFSNYGTDPRGNPFGGQASWAGPAS